MMFVDILFEDNPETGAMKNTVPESDHGTVLHHVSVSQGLAEALGDGVLAVVPGKVLDRVLVAELALRPVHR